MGTHHNIGNLKFYNTLFHITNSSFVLNCYRFTALSRDGSTFERISYKGQEGKESGAAAGYL